MKKLLLSLLTLLTCSIGFASASTVLFDIKNCTISENGGPEQDFTGFSSLSNGAAISAPIKINNDITISTNGKYYSNTSGKTIRVYSGNNLEIAGATGIILTKIEINFSNNPFKGNVYTKKEGGDYPTSGTSYNQTNDGTPYTWSTQSSDAINAVKFKHGGSVAYISKITITYEVGQGGGDDPDPGLKEATLAFSDASLDVKVGETVDGLKLTTQDTDGDITIESLNPEIAAYDATTGKVTGVAVGTATIKATSAKTETYDEGTATYTVNVSANIPESSIDNPLTVAKALEICAYAPKSVYVKGIVTKVTTVYSEQFSNVTYNIADEANGTELEVYRGKWGADVTAPTDKNPEVGATVIVKGDLQVYNSKKQFAKDSQIVSYTAPENPGPVLLPAGLEFSAAEHTVKVGETVDGLALTKPEDNTGVVTYTSSNDAIATVNAETGAVTGVAAGTVTITATSTETDKYKAGKASYTLTVVDPNAPVVTEATFNFADNAENGIVGSGYGLTPISDSNKYEKDQENPVTEISSGIVKIGFYGDNYRYWSSDKTLRVQSGSSFTVSVPETYYISEISMSGTSKSDVDNGTFNNGSWSNGGKLFSIVKFSPASTTKIKSITVKYAKKPTLESADITINHGTYDGEIVIDYAFTIANHNGHELIVEAYIDGMDDVVFAPEENAPEEPAAVPARVAGENTVIIGRLKATHDGLKGAIKPQINIKATLDGNELYNKKHAPTTTTGVNDIVADDANAPVEYYNLQGVRVANPESGLYIRVQGKKATKVLVK